MRLSEAINLRLEDITEDGLVIRNTKFGKSRLIPLHPTAQAALERYLPKRRLFAPSDDHIFVSLRKHKLLRHDAYVVFRKSIENSSDVYKSIKNNIADWVEEAVTIRAAN
jgi:integrase